MIGTSPVQNQRDVFRPLLADFIDMEHDLVVLADKIDWSLFEKEFAPLYSSTGQPAEPIIGHLKSDHRMQQNYLHGPDSPYKTLLAATG